MNDQNNSVNNDHGFIGTGTPYFYPDDDLTVFFFGNPISCKITSSSDKKVRKSRRKEDAGASLDTRSIPNPAEVSISTDTFQPRTWAMAMSGEAGKVTKSAQTITDEAAIAIFDGYHQLANSDIDPTTVVVKKDGSVVEAEKYKINPSMGLLQIIDETAAQVGDDLTVDYKTRQVTKIVIEAAKVSSFKGKIVIDGKNDVTGEPAKLIIPNVSLSVDGDFDWFSDDFNEIEMKGTASIGKNGEPPYTIELYP
ncbi:hypothetical protein [Psychrobacter sp. I-STPA10]|uniref:phage tail tube protein n=1 Tax=Psychrobacter sp. I-STPA10 TaxID=2585769 RepID=UPI001E301DBE|nr:hypothetical protein [Psychrobacter sp. I-STPA10]